MATTPAPAPDRAVVARLERIATLDRGEATAAEVLLELQGLLRDAEALAASRDAEEVVARRRPAPHGT
ncbi:MAG TPA: hypothetical protein VFP78_10190 [Solirubrobacteraceae bacterium]|nr:hypothetical protein [Solirubrobacteraceae bacterium]